jgi:hypothetical protein
MFLSSQANLKYFPISSDRNNFPLNTKRFLLSLFVSFMSKFHMNCYLFDMALYLMCSFYRINTKKE